MHPSRTTTPKNFGVATERGNYSDSLPQSTQRWPRRYGQNEYQQALNEQGFVTAKEQTRLRKHA